MRKLYRRLLCPIGIVLTLQTPNDADCATIIHVPDQGFVLGSTGESGLVDIGGFDRPLDFFARQNAVLSWYWEPVAPLFHEVVPAPFTGSSAMRFDAGIEIGNDLSWTRDLRNAATLASASTIEPGLFYDAEGFLAVRIYEEERGWENAEALPYYGWIRVSHSADEMALTVHDWAWNSTLGEPILAGQIPEPQTYAVLFGLGILMYVIVRRRFV